MPLAVITLGLIFADKEEEVLRTDRTIPVNFAAISVAYAECMAKFIFIF